MDKNSLYSMNISLMMADCYAYLWYLIRNSLSIRFGTGSASNGAQHISQEIRVVYVCSFV